MASFVLSNAFFSVNSVDLSDHVKSVTVKGSKDGVENTAMSSTNAKTELVGLESFTIDVEFNQDFAASKVDATLWAIYSGNASVAVDVKATNAARSTTNPSFTGSVLLLEYTPVDGSVGALAAVKVTFTGTGALARQTS